MSTHDKYALHTYSYLALRKAVGWIGILLPFVLMFGLCVLFTHEAMPPSISDYYYTGMRNVFVGGLCAVALFMFFYCGYDHLDNWTGNIAGFFAICVAFFPTTESGTTDLIGWIHYGSAAIFFLSLSFFSLFLFTKSKKNVKPSPQKLARNKIYIICGVIMLACIIGIAVKSMIGGSKQWTFVYWAETVALVAFGISWLTKGEALYPDKNA
jgi:hypothetical protein